LFVDWSKRQSPPKLTASGSGGATSSPHLPAGKSRDFSLKEGETISIKLGGNSAIKKKQESDLTGLGGGGSGSLGGGLGGFKLAPPPPAPPRGR